VEQGVVHQEAVEVTAAQGLVEPVAETQAETAVTQESVVPAHDAAYVAEVAKELSEKRPGGLSAFMGDKKRVRVAAILFSVVGISAFGFIFASQFFSGTKISSVETAPKTAVQPPVPKKPTPAATASGSTGSTVATAPIAQT
jgi:hypothetical protein